MQNNIEHSEHALAAFLVKGDENAFRQLHDKYQGRLMYYTLKWSLLKDEAEDIVAETFLKLWQNRETFLSEAHIRNFLFVTTRNNILNLLDFKKRQKGYLEKYENLQNSAAGGFSPERMEAELIQLLYTAMEALPGECRKIFRLYLDDRTTAEIASELDISPATVRSQKRRAILMIKQWLSEHGSTLPMVWSLICYLEALLN